MENEIKNGDIVRDIETGFIGKIVAITYHLNGRIDCHVTDRQNQQHKRKIYHNIPILRYEIPIMQLVLYSAE